MFYIIRIICFLVLILLMFYLFKILHIRFTRLKCVSCIGLTFILIFVSFIFPPEAYILNFDTAESALQYRYNVTPQSKIEGKNSCMLAYNTGERTSSVAFISKEDGYKIGNRFSKNVICTGIWEEYSFEIYKYGNYDYYITISGFLDDTENVTITDNYGSEFIDLSKEPNAENYALYATYVYNLNENDYSVVINGKNIELLSKG